jgi:deoxyhypusine synthase
VPLVRAGFIDWIVSTGANLYHETHFALGLPLFQSRPGSLDDRKLREQQVIRIYDIVFDYKTLLDTDSFYREIIRSEPFQRTMSSSEFHWHVGQYVAERERALGGEPKSLLAECHRLAVPIYTSAPGDSSIGMNIAALQLEGGQLRIDPSLDVNETASLVYDAKRRGGASAVVIFGGGSPKNFMLQTEPQIQEVLGLEEAGHDYFIQFTDARPDTGGLSGATPGEAVTWGKVDPDKLPDSVTCYTDSTIALPILTAYALSNHAPRTHRRLFDRRLQLMDTLKASYLGQK